MLTPVLSQGPQGEAVGCSQGGGIKVPGLSLSRDPMSKAGPAAPARGPPMPKGHLTLPITSRVVVSFLVHQGSYNRNHRLGLTQQTFFFFFFSQFWRLEIRSRRQHRQCLVRTHFLIIGG